MLAEWFTPLVTSRIITLKVLFLILKKLGFDWSKDLFHLSYGMVDLPSGKMKSREGTVVDADDLMVEMTQTAQNLRRIKGKLDGYSDGKVIPNHRAWRTQVLYPKSRSKKTHPV